MLVCDNDSVNRFPHVYLHTVLQCASPNTYGTICIMFSDKLFLVCIPGLDRGMYFTKNHYFCTHSRYSFLINIPKHLTSVHISVHVIPALCDFHKQCCYHSRPCGGIQHCTVIQCRKCKCQKKVKIHNFLQYVNVS